MSVTLTGAAIDHISRSIRKRGRGLGIKLGVRTTGCSGMAYVLEYIDEPDLDSSVTECGDFLVYIDPKSMVYLSGIEVDFKREGLQEGLSFNNPNERSKCGCGESFSV